MRSLRGVSLVDVVVGSALVLIIFSGLFGLLRASMQVAGLSKLRATATELASSQMEYLRSLAYEDVGTVGGIPSGLVPQYATTTMAGVSYGVRTYVEYTDDAADGTGGSDTNFITTDYKRAKVAVTYTVSGTPRTVTLVSTITPKGIESTVGGGTLQVRAVDALGVPVAGASVTVVNPSVSPTVGLSTFTDAAGLVWLPGAPTSTDYRISVSKDGFSSAQTYARDATNQNPTPGYLTVVGGSTTSGTFAIDRLATLILRTFSPIRAALWNDSFNDSSNVVSTASTQIAGGALSLTSGEFGYSSSGSATSVAITPAYLARWSSASTTASVPGGTEFRLQVLDGTGALLPDAVLPGNASGFTGAITLSSISTTTYPSLALRAELSSGNPALTPSIEEWRLGYDEGPIPLPNVSFTLVGGKTVGSTGAGASIYKTTVSTSTGALASSTLQLEWDTYTLTVPGRTIIFQAPEAPYELLPGAALDATLILQ